MKPGGTVAWLDAKAAAAYLGIRTMNAFYVFLHKERSRENGLRIHRLHGRLRFRITDLERCIDQEKSVDELVHEARASMRVVRGPR